MKTLPNVPITNIAELLEAIKGLPLDTPISGYTANRGNLLPVGVWSAIDDNKEILIIDVG